MSPPATALRVSVVMPAYDEGARLPALAAAIVERLEAVADAAVEVIVVDDGSAADESARMGAAVAHAAAALHARDRAHAFRFVRAPRNEGKGSAIRLGWRHADPAADWLGWMDADGAVSAAELVRAIGLLRTQDGADVVAGSRVKMAGRTVRRRVFRHVQGRVFAALTEAWLRLGVYDTQCGLKLVRASALRPLLPLLREDGWMLDVEVLAHVKASGARIVELPIDWVDGGPTKVRFGIDPLRMLWALVRIRARVRATTAGRMGAGGAPAH